MTEIREVTQADRDMVGHIAASLCPLETTEEWDMMASFLARHRLAAISAVLQDLETPTTIEQVELGAAAEKTSQGRPFNWVDAAMAVLKTRSSQYRKESSHD